MAKRPINFDVFNEVQLIPPSEELDYSVYDIDNGCRYVYDPRNQLEETSHRNYVKFVKSLEERGGVKEFMLATTRQIADMQTGNSSTLGRAGIAGDVPKFRENATRTLIHANRWHRAVQFPAKLATIQAHYGYDTDFEWVLRRFAEGHAYNDIAHALGVELSTLTTWLWNRAPHEQLAAAQKARTSFMLDQADNLMTEAMHADYGVIQEGLAAEQKAKVLSALSPHLRMQAVAHHAAYQPKTSQVTVTPGSISISFAAPE